MAPTTAVHALIYGIIDPDSTSESTTLHQVISLNSNEVKSKMEDINNSANTESIEILFNGFVPMDYPLAFVLTDPAIQSALAQAILAGQREERAQWSAHNECVARSYSEAQRTNRE